MVVIPAALLAGLLAIGLVLAYLLLQHAAQAWLRPILQWIFAPRQAFWKRVLLWPVREIGHGLAAVERFVMRVLGDAYFAAASVVGRWLHAYAYVLDNLFVGLEALARDVRNAFAYTRNVMVPALIRAATRPMLDDINLAKSLAQAATTTLTGISIAFAEGLRSLPWGAPTGIINRVNAFWNAFEHIWDQVFKHVIPRLDLIQYTTLPRLGARVDDIFDDLYRDGIDSLPRIRTRLRNLEEKLRDIGTSEWWQTGVTGAIAALAGVSIAAVSIGLRALFCRNTQNVARKICAMDEALLAGLLAGSLTFALEIDPRLVVRVGQEMENGLEGILRDMANV